MSSTKFWKIAKQVARERRKLFESLLEYERRGKIRTKERVTFTVDKSVASQFRKFCRKNGYNMSAKVEQAMRKLLRKH